MSVARYLVCPGYVLSQSDGQEHYIEARKLMALYGVGPSQCLIFDGGRHRGVSLCEYNELIILRPRYDGDYT